MANYFRITAYHPEQDFCMIMDTYGLFEKKWQFSADLIKRGFKILEVSDIDQVIDVNYSFDRTRLRKIHTSSKRTRTAKIYRARSKRNNL